MAVESVFHFERRDVFAAGDDDVLGTVLDFDVAVGLDHRQVAGVKPAAGKSGGGGSWVFEVALHGEVAAEHHLADGLAVGGHGLQGLRIHDGEALRGNKGYALAAIETGPVANVELVPFRVFGAVSGGAISFGKPINVGDTKAAALHGF